MLKTILFLGIVVSLLGCSRENLDNLIENNSKIVVEGWIEEGDVPQVILSRSVPINEVVDTIQAMDYFIRSAKVTVSDGEKEEVLRLKTDKYRFPPFVYYGTDMIGVSGKKYTLKVEYLDKTLESSTTIPLPVAMKSAKYVRENIENRTGSVFIEFEDPIKDKNYYQILTKVEGSEDLFVPSLYGNLDDDTFQNPDVTVRIQRGGTFFPKKQFYPFFSDGDVINVKLRTMNKDGYDFWNSWQNEIINGKSPIFPNTTSLKSNIKGGIGVWQGYGHSALVVKAK